MGHEARPGDRHPPLPRRSAGGEKDPPVRNRRTRSCGPPGLCAARTGSRPAGSFASRASRRPSRALDEAGARYLLIGGFAVILHGGERTTKGIDLLVDPAPDNVERLKSALSILEDNAAREIAPDDLARYTVVRVADEVMVDLLAAACGVTWAEAQGSARQVDLDGTPVLVVDRRTLIQTKQTIRPSDAADRAWLESLPDDSR